MQYLIQACWKRTKTKEGEISEIIQQGKGIYTALVQCLHQESVKTLNVIIT